jgi:putative spermidine/putrescine transport system permease protein
MRIRVETRRLLPKLLMAPFFLLTLMFLIFPLAALVASSLSRGFGSFKAVVSNPIYLRGFMNSLKLSTAVTLQASAFGGLLAVLWAKKINSKSWFLAILNFAANNGGITLAFAMIATLGTNGFLTLILRKVGFDLQAGFDIVSLAGLNFVYLCFLVPYMAIMFLPAAGSMRAEWWQAAQSLGAYRTQYIMKIGVPVLLPSFLSSSCLVFLNALGTYATASAISAANVNLITLQIGYLIQTSVFKQADAYTISFILLLVMLAFIFVYRKATLRAERWLQ